MTYSWVTVEEAIALHNKVDGNKRTAFVVMTVFLLKNGYELVVPEPEAVSVMVSLAKSETSQEVLATWIFSNILALPS